MSDATKHRKTFGEWWHDHFELPALLGLGLLIILAALYGAGANLGVGA